MLNTEADLAGGRIGARLSLAWPGRLPAPHTGPPRCRTHSSSLSRTSRGTGSRDRRQAWFMCWISPSRCWCWAPNMWSWNSYDRREGGVGVRTEPRGGGQGWAEGGGLQPWLSWPPQHHREAISLTTTLCGPQEDGKLRHSASTQQPGPPLLLEPV